MAPQMNGTGRPADVLVVSDLHLGGEVGFQMCAEDGQHRLAEFFRWAAGQRRTDRDLHLVLAGDVVDFLAEANADGTWSAFTGDEAQADAKLARILERTGSVWEALRALADAGASMTLLLGNHDLELSLPAPRRRLVAAIAPRGRLELLYDGEAFRRGELLVEHGNRYEGWNAVLHDSLRRVRSRLSRGEPAGDFLAQPGSELVVRVMNPIKRRFGFIDLLKPETSGAIPILAVLDPGAWRGAAAFMRQAAAAAWRQLQFQRSGMPAPVTHDVALEGVEGAGAPPHPDADALDLADELAAQGGAAGVAEESVPGDLGHRIEVALLLRAFRKRVEKDGETFQVDRESELYLRPARVLAEQGARVVVFGHTHHAKRVGLGGGRTYLNTGTWAGLMRIPEAVYTGAEGEARAALQTFLTDLQEDRLDALRSLVPTFARVALDGRGRVEDADVLFFDGPRAVEPITTPGVLARLGFGAGRTAEVAPERAPEVGAASAAPAARVALVLAAGQDAAWAEREIVPVLPCNGYDRWIALAPGGAFPVAEAARASQVALVVVSRSAAGSRELATAVTAVAQAGTPIVPVILDDTAPASLAKELERVPAADFRGAGGAVAGRRDEARRELAGLLPAAPIPETAAAAPWIRTIAWDGGVFSAELAQAVARREPSRIEHLVGNLERSFPASRPLAAPGDAAADLKRLRSIRAFDAMLHYTGAVLRAGSTDVHVLRQRSQALIELGEFAQAVATLERIAADPSAPEVERGEALGLLGRAYKQRYVNDPAAQGAGALLAESIGAYRRGYASDAERTWHGVNLATCLLRSARDGGGPAQAREAAEVAAKVLETLRAREAQAGSLQPWDLATRFEALLVLDRREEAATALDAYLVHPGLSAFEVSSTHRQLIEVLQADRGPAAELVQKLARAVERYRMGGAIALTRSADKDAPARSRRLVIRTTDVGWEPRGIPNLTVIARSGTVVSAKGDDDAMRALLRDGRVVTVEEDRAGGLVECAISMPFIGATAVHAAAGGEKGSEALVAVIDNGIDVLHEAFLDDERRTRIEEIWDQRDPTGPAPDGFTFGTVHRREEIEGYIKAGKVLKRLGRNEHGHGTHVASIAAGRRTEQFAGGVAPEARLLVVVSSLQGPIGYSESHIAALDYIHRFAGKRPVVVNVSQGMNAGAHDGRSALEEAFDRFTDGGRRPGRVVVKSVGNEGDQGGHALFTLRSGSKGTLSWTRSAAAGDERIELWFSAADEFRFRLVDPAGNAAGWADTQAPDRQAALGPTACRLQLTKRHIDNGDSQLLVELGGAVQVGVWQLEIVSDRVPAGGVVQGWIERGVTPPSSFNAPWASADMTLSIPGTAMSVITVGAIAPAVPIELGTFSSLGPTRDGRNKPDVAAPGIGILAADGGSTFGARPDRGTSMAAPHVTGAIALLLSRQARTTQVGLTASQIASALRQTASNYDGHWDRGQGWGTIDVQALLRAFS